MQISSSAQRSYKHFDLVTGNFYMVDTITASGLHSRMKKKYAYALHATS